MLVNTEQITTYLTLANENSVIQDRTTHVHKHSIIVKIKTNTTTYATHLLSVRCANGNPLAPADDNGDDGGGGESDDGTDNSCQRIVVVAAAADSSMIAVACGTVLYHYCCPRLAV